VALVPDSVYLVAHQSGGTVMVGLSRQWGMGVPLLLHDEVRAVLSRSRPGFGASSAQARVPDGRCCQRGKAAPTAAGVRAWPEILCVPVVVRRPDAMAASAL
jgi:hypothetical protein